MEIILLALAGIFAIAALLVTAKMSADFVVCSILLLVAYTVAMIITVTIDELLRDRKGSEKI